MIKKGDYVRFLNEVGGGNVTRVDEKEHLVYVEDEDGFEIPVLDRECVVVDKVNEKTNFPINPLFQTKAEETTLKTEVPREPTKKEKPVEEHQLIETPEGDNLRIAMAFFPNDIKNLSNTSYDCYLVNDSNYFLYFNFVYGTPGNRKSLANGLIEPNIQEFLLELQKEELNEWEQLHIQIIPFKKDKIYTEQAVLDYTLKINTVKFYKLHSFLETEYFEEPCMLIDLVKESQRKQLENVSPEEIKAAMLNKKPEKSRKRIEPQRKQRNVIQVDLHIEQLLDVTTGLTNAEILQYQMDVFHKTLEENRKKKGQKIVFIHGKGEGVLRKEIEKQLRSKYKAYYFQDASFKEYGFGATMVTIK